jgi:hypothetical protein
MTDIKVYAQEELARLEKDRKEAMEAKGFKPFYKLTVGKHVVEFSMDVAPRENTMYPGRVIMRVLANGEERDISVSRAGPLYKAIMGYLAQGINKLSIQRIGTGVKDTRYVVEPAQ